MDAYAIRKMVPRILIGAIAINLSLYLCIAAADVIKVIGNGIGGLLTAPFVDGENFDFKIGNSDLHWEILQNVLVGYAVGKGAFALKDVAAGLFSVGDNSQNADTLMFFLFTLLVPIAIISLAVLATLVIRQGLLTFLIIVSPIAVALYILPSTEKYFRKWLDLFIKTLLVYPIIAVIFAMSDILSSIIFKTNQNPIGILTGMAVMFVPLVLIPFSFKFAGGAIGAIYSAATNAGSKLQSTGFIKGRREHYGEQASDNILRAKARAYRRSVAQGEAAQSRGKIIGGLGYQNARRNQRRLMGYRSDLMDREAAVNARMQEAQQKTTSSGDDTLQRAYTVNLKAAQKDMRAKLASNPDYNGGGAGDLWKRDASGQVQYKSAGGAWYSESAVAESRRKYGERNTAQLQQSLSYEMGKALTQDDQDNIVESFGTTANEWNLNESEASGVWIGAAYPQQQVNRQWKHAKWGKDDAGNFAMTSGGLNLMREIDEKQGAYQGTMQNADTWTTMSQEVQRAQQIVSGQRAGTGEGGLVTAKDVSQSQEVIQRAARIADSLGREGAVMPTDEDGKGTTQRPMGSGVGAGAPGRVGEEMRAFAEIARSGANTGGQSTGAYDPTNFGTAPGVRTSDPSQAVNDRDQGTNPGNPGSGRRRNM